MADTLKVSEIFNSIQGEGRYQGTPVTFIRLSGCSRSCTFCDTSYHTKGRNIGFKELFNQIENLRGTKPIVFTGGEPLLQFEELKKFRNNYPLCNWHLETNGDLIRDEIKLKRIFDYFDYVVVSPKNLKIAKKVYHLLDKVGGNWDIKVVTDLDKVGTNILKYATMVMPLTTYNEKKDKEIKQKVWEYCVSHNLPYSARLHVDVWGKKQKV